jgi:hypothetical protein
VTHPKWKQRAINAKAELEAAEQAARHQAFWAAVPQPKQAPRPFDDEFLFAVPPQPNEVPF